MSGQIAESMMGMIRAQRQRDVAVTGVIAAAFADDLDEGISRVRAAGEAAAELAQRSDHRRRDSPRWMYEEIGVVAALVEAHLEQLRGAGEKP